MHTQGALVLKFFSLIQASLIPIFLSEPASRKNQDNIKIKTFHKTSNNKVFNIPKKRSSINQVIRQTNNNIYRVSTYLIINIEQNFVKIHPKISNVDSGHTYIITLICRDINDTNIFCWYPSYWRWTTNKLFIEISQG